MPLALKINVALREQNCQKISSERVKYDVGSETVKCAIQAKMLKIW